MTGGGLKASFIEIKEGAANLRHPLLSAAVNQRQQVSISVLPLRQAQ